MRVFKRIYERLCRRTGASGDTDILETEIWYVFSGNKHLQPTIIGSTKGIKQRGI